MPGYLMFFSVIISPDPDSGNFELCPSTKYVDILSGTWSFSPASLTVQKSSTDFVAKLESHSIMGTFVEEQKERFRPVPLWLLNIQKSDKPTIYYFERSIWFTISARNQLIEINLKDSITDANVILPYPGS
jgi:hypothetical protein